MCLTNENKRLTLRMKHKIDLNDIDQYFMKRFIYIALMVSAIALCSCDTPQTMAWNHYYYAQSLFEEGELKRAQKFAEQAASHNDYKRRNEELAAKIIKLQDAIEQAMQANDSIQSNEENNQK